MDLSNAFNDELKHLAETCDAATFGVAQQDVLDESYRRAGKLDSTYFSMHFDAVRAGLVDGVRDHLLEVDDSQRAITAELYKLNVYGVSITIFYLLPSDQLHRSRRKLVLQVAQGYTPKREYVWFTCARLSHPT